ncbi:hypothetical protein CAEBREN_18385 [Caenorhabditis brenneri]|uniref:Uncharacterized protein n=1 Tax=Caenorhabditis brenneri TaxID=135651 RepID=G0MDK5_CAEBE|nr:hypothetical protein CAEBREN_18385 [Caenorhabditis brenneri]
MGKTPNAMDVATMQLKKGDHMNILKKWYKAADSSEKKQFRNDYKENCNKFFETEEYKSGDPDYNGYVACCEILEMCGTSGWTIFLIIVLVLGVLAGGAAAFWFFYWKRKYGGKEEMVDENTESTENSKTVIEIPVGTY